MRQYLLAIIATTCFIPIAQGASTPVPKVFVKHRVVNGKHIYSYRVVKDSSYKLSTITIGSNSDNYFLDVFPENFIPMEEDPTHFTHTSPKNWKGQVLLQEENPLHAIEWTLIDRKIVTIGEEEISGFSVTLDKEDSAYERSYSDLAALQAEPSIPLTDLSFKLRVVKNVQIKESVENEKTLESNITFAIPSTIERTNGANNGYELELQFRPLKEKENKICLYSWSSELKVFKFSSCNDGRVASDNALAGWFKIALKGDSSIKEPLDASVNLVPLQESETIVTMTAQKLYNPSKWENGYFSMRKDTDFLVPAKLSVKEGNGGNHKATLKFQKKDGSVDTCTYQGGASQAHPNSDTQKKLGLNYNFKSCTSGSKSGSKVVAQKITLSVDNGDSYLGSTKVEAKISVANK